MRAAETASRNQSRVVVLHVIPSPLDRDSSQVDATSGDREQAFASATIDRALATLTEKGVEGEGVVKEGPPLRVILDQIAALRPSAVVFGSRSQDDLIPEGSIAQRISKAADIAVEVVR